MRFVRAVLMAVGVLALLRWALAAFFLLGSHQAPEKNDLPKSGLSAASPAGELRLVSETHGQSSFLMRQIRGSSARQRVTAAQSGIESEPAFSQDGKLVAYTVSPSATSATAVWIVGADGSNPHPLTAADEDALHPVFSPDDTTIFYAASRWTGHNSPIAAPRRHEWDVFSRRIDATPAAPAQQITNESFYDLRSLDAPPSSGRLEPR